MQIEFFQFDFARENSRRCEQEIAGQTETLNKEHELRNCSFDTESWLREFEKQNRHEFNT